MATTRKMDRKARVQELAGDIAVSSAFEAAAVKELLELMIQDATEALVDAQPADFQKLQGEAQSLRKLFTLVTRPAPALRSKE